MKLHLEGQISTGLDFLLPYSYRQLHLCKAQALLNQSDSLLYPVWTWVHFYLCKVMSIQIFSSLLGTVRKKSEKTDFHNSSFITSLNSATYSAKWNSASCQNGGKSFHMKDFLHIQHQKVFLQDFDGDVYSQFLSILHSFSGTGHWLLATVL